MILMQQVQNEAYSLTDELRRIQKDEKTSAAQRAVRAREIARKGHREPAQADRCEAEACQRVRPAQRSADRSRGHHCRSGPDGYRYGARPDRNGMVEVRAGIMKTKVPLSNLRAPDKMEKRKPAEPRRSTRVQLDKSRKTSMELNLLGYTVDEALNEVDKFLDSGMLRAVHPVYHPRQRHRRPAHRHQEASAHPQGGQKLRLGRYGEGESGVTVVELK